MKFSDKLVKIGKILSAGIEKHPFLERLKERIEQHPLDLTVIEKSNIADYQNFDEIRVHGINTQETTTVISLGLRIGNQYFDGTLFYYNTSILPLKLHPLKLQFILNVLSNGSIAHKNKKLKNVIQAGLAKLEYYPK